jgi:hypothetical protein
LRAGDLSILVTEQNVRWVLQIADRAYLIDTGAIVREGPPSELAEQEALLEQYLGEGAYALIGMLDQSIPNNGGIRRVADVHFRDGSVVKPRFPAPMNQYMSSCIAVTEAVIRALCGFAPGEQMAGCGGVGGNSRRLRFWRTSTRRACSAGS